MRMTLPSALPLRWAFALATLCIGASGNASDGGYVDGSWSMPIGPGGADLRGLSGQVLNKDPGLALGNAMSALAVAERGGDGRAIHLALVQKANAEQHLGLFTEFLQTTLRALEVAQTISDPRLMARDLQNLSTAYGANMRPDNAIAEAKNALAMVLPTQDERAIAEAQLFLIHTLNKGGDHLEALKVGEVALERAARNNDELVQARIWLLMAEAFMEQERHVDALPFLAKAERTLDVSGTFNERFMLRVDRSRAFAAIGRADEADKALTGAIGMMEGSDSWSHQAAITKARYELELSRGDWRAALSHLQRIKDQDDSLARAHVDLKMAGLQMAYQMDRKDRDNAALRELNAQNESIIADQRVNNRYLWVLVCGVLVFGCACFFISRHSLRVMKRLKRKNLVVRRQHEEIEAKNLELQRQNLRLAETLISEEEKEIMIKEIHHRVKNNLQVMDSLLTAQGVSMKDEKVERMFREAQGRIRSMALVHEHIYRNEHRTDTTLQAYISQLARNVLVAYGLHDRVSVTVNARLPVFDEETLMPLSLVVNEMLTNSVKYAFNGRDSGHVDIVIRTAGDAYELIFRDNGIGHSEPGGAGREGSFGLELINALATQLNGELRSLKGAGTGFCFTFKPDGRVLRVAS